MPMYPRSFCLVPSLLYVTVPDLRPPFLSTLHSKGAASPPSSPAFILAVAQLDIEACISCSTQPRRYAPVFDFGIAWEAHGKHLTIHTARSPAHNHSASALNAMCIRKVLPASFFERCLVPAQPKLLRELLSLFF